MIKPSDILNMVYKNLLVNKKRTILTILGIIIGVFLFVMFNLISFGLQNLVVEQFSKSGLDIVGVQKVESGIENGPPTGNDLYKSDISKIKKYVKNYKYIQGGIFYSTNIKYKNKVGNFLFLGYEDWEKLRLDLNPEILTGNEIKNDDVGKIVIGYKVSTSFDEEKILRVGEKFEVDGKKFKIKGILKEQGDLLIDNSITVSFDDIKKISNQDSFSIIRISFKKGVNIDEEIKNLDLKLNGKKKIYSFNSPKFVIKKINSILQVLTFVILFISSISLIVGGINILNIMYSNVISRSNEISTFKAFGGTNFDVLKLFLFESFLLGFVGSLIGYFVAYFFSLFISLIINSFGFNFIVDFNFYLFLKMIFGISLMTIIFGIYPAIKALKINPSDNLRDD